MYWTPSIKLHTKFPSLIHRAIQEVHPSHWMDLLLKAKLKSSRATKKVCSEESIKRHDSIYDDYFLNKNYLKLKKKFLRL